MKIGFLAISPQRIVRFALNFAVYHRNRVNNKRVIEIFIILKIQDGRQSLFWINLSWVVLNIVKPSYLSEISTIYWWKLVYLYRLRLLKEARDQHLKYGKFKMADDRNIENSFWPNLCSIMTNFLQVTYHTRNRINGQITKKKSI